MKDPLGMRYLGITYPFQKNDGGRSKSLRPNEKNDCTVRCLAIAFGLQYDLAYDILTAAAGYRPGKGCHFRQWLGKRRTFNRYRITWIEFPAVKGQQRMNPVIFAKTYHRGRYICRTAKHVYAVIDGVVQDNNPEYNERCIYGAYRLEPAKAAARRTRRTTTRRRRPADNTARQNETRQRPFIGPCNDPMELWFLEFDSGIMVYRRYYADGPEARAALKHYKATGELLPSEGGVVKTFLAERKAVQ